MPPSGLRVGDGWLLLPQPSPAIAVCRLDPRDDNRAIAALPPDLVPATLARAQVVLRTGERRSTPDQLKLLLIANELQVQTASPVPPEHWHGARLELYAKPGC